MIGLDVRVDPDAAGAEVEQADLAERLEIMDRLVHGLQRDRRHLGAGGVVERFHRRVPVVAVQQAEDRLALGRDPQALGAEEPSELGGRLHQTRMLSTIVVASKPLSIA